VKFLEAAKYKKSAEKIIEMLRGYSDGCVMLPCFYEEVIYEMLIIKKEAIPLEIYHDSSAI
jgi:hypothetical protein